MLEHVGAGPASRFSRGGSPQRPFGHPSEREWVRATREGVETVRKVFGRDERELAQHEAKALDRARGRGVPELFGCDDGERPFIELAWIGDEDLRMAVGRRGPLPSDEVLRIGKAAAAVLARLHAMSIVHGDVKPANFVHTAGGELHLIDFENVVFLTDGTPEHAPGFSGGTFGYAPPEAYLGESPTIAFDLYGLGATLHVLLTGFLPPLRPSGEFDARTLLRLRPTMPFALLGAVRNLLQADPTKRRAATSIAAALAAAESADTRLELALLAGTPHPSEQHRDVIALRSHWAERCQTVLESLPETEATTNARAFVEAGLRFCRAIHVCLNFVPLLPLARARLERAHRKLAHRLPTLPVEVQRLRENMKLAEARHLARLGLDFCQIVSVLHLPDRGAPRVVEATGHALQSALRRLDHEDARQREILAELETAEAALDLTAAKRALDELLETFSGANDSSARVRDRHQRFVWLLHRLAAGQEGLHKGVDLLTGRDVATPCTLLTTYLDRVAAAVDVAPDRLHRSLSLLARVLSELHEGYPKLGLGPMSRELGALRLRLTERVTALLDQMTQRLEADPVPLRLILRDLLEVDQILILDCLIDTPRLHRTRLIDRLERTRLRIEEIADSHKHLRAGAREQMEQGRLTTALYDLERALEASSASLDVENPDDLGLRKELEMVRKLRDDVRNATTRNLELQDTYGRLLDARGSFAERVRCLDQREQVLSFLLDKGPGAFRPRYERDLQELRLCRIQDFCDEAEERLQVAASTAEEREIASEVLAKIDGYNGGTTPGEGGDRGQRLQRRWSSYYDRAHEALESAERDHQEARALRRRRVRLIAAIAVTASIAIAFALRGSFGTAIANSAESIATASPAELRRQAAKPEIGEPVQQTLRLLAEAVTQGQALERNGAIADPTIQQRLTASLERVRRAAERIENARTRDAVLARVASLLRH